MNKTLTPSKIEGTLTIPASKSQTIRALLIATAAAGTSRIANPLRSQDTLSCVRACRSLGSRIELEDAFWEVTGIGLDADYARQHSDKRPLIIDTGNSGTTLYLGIGIAAATGRPVIFTGDEQIRSRPVAALLASYRDLGAEVTTQVAGTYGLEPSLKKGAPPFLICGPLTGGSTTIECPTSQYLSSLLLAAPIASGDTLITVPLLNERPYAEMTADWLREQEIQFGSQRDPVDRYSLPGRQHYRPFSRRISGDFSSASFFLCAAAITGSTITLLGLDANDSQGDKDILSCLEQMGAHVSWSEGAVTLTGPEAGLAGGHTFDLNPIPDTLPVLAAACCFATGTTRLVNVPQARIKETDRITVMRQELSRLGADIEELEDGLVIRGTGSLTGGTVSGHGDHRVIMACAVAALACSGPVTIEGTEAVDITCPDFFALLDEAVKKG